MNEDLELGSETRIVDFWAGWSKPSKTKAKREMTTQRQHFGEEENGKGRRLELKINKQTRSQKDAFP